jgi:hypothetical protein
MYLFHFRMSAAPIAAAAFTWRAHVRGAVSVFLLRVICTLAATTAVFIQSQQEVCSIAQLQQMEMELNGSSAASTAAVLDNDVAESVMQRCLIASVQNLGSNWQVSGGEQQ